jgi:hypothetical protein
MIGEAGLGELKLGIKALAFGFNLNSWDRNEIKSAQLNVLFLRNFHIPNVQKMLSNRRSSE